MSAGPWPPTSYGRHPARTYRSPARAVRAAGHPTLRRRAGVRTNARRRRAQPHRRAARRPTHPRQARSAQGAGGESRSRLPKPTRGLRGRADPTPARRERPGCEGRRAAADCLPNYTAGAGHPRGSSVPRRDWSLSHHRHRPCGRGRSVPRQGGRRRDVRRLRDRLPRGPRRHERGGAVPSARHGHGRGVPPRRARRPPRAPERGRAVEPNRWHADVRLDREGDWSYYVDLVGRSVRDVEAQGGDQAAGRHRRRAGAGGGRPGPRPGRRRRRRRARAQGAPEGPRRCATRRDRRAAALRRRGAGRPGRAGGPPPAGAPALLRPVAGPGRASARALRRLVRVLPSLRGRDPGPAAVGHVPHRRQATARRCARWASTSSTCRRSTRSGTPSARAPTTR